MYMGVYLAVYWILYVFGKVHSPGAHPAPPISTRILLGFFKPWVLGGWPVRRLFREQTHTNVEVHRCMWVLPVRKLVSFLYCF